MQPSPTLAVLNIETMWVGYFLFSVAASLIASSKLQQRLKQQQPEAHPYRWGYFFGCMGLASGPLALICAFASLKNFETARCAEWAFLFFFVYAVCGWFIIQRMRWAWGLGTLMSLNPILWIINLVYVLRRFQELAKDSQKMSMSLRIRLGLCAIGTLIGGAAFVCDGIGLKWENAAEGLTIGLTWSLAAFLVGVPVLAIIWRFFLRRLSELSRAARGQYDG